MENFGKKGEDKITGFKGTITAMCSYMYGCNQYLLTPIIDKEGKRPDGEWFDVGRIKVTGKGIKVEDVKAEEDGCEVQAYPTNKR